MEVHIDICICICMYKYLYVYIFSGASLIINIGHWKTVTTEVTEAHHCQTRS